MVTSLMFFPLSPVQFPWVYIHTLHCFSLLSVVSVFSVSWGKGTGTNTFGMLFVFSHIPVGLRGIVSTKYFTQSFPLGLRLRTICCSYVCCVGLRIGHATLDLLSMKLHQQRCHATFGDLLQMKEKEKLDIHLIQANLAVCMNGC